MRPKHLPPLMGFASLVLFSFCTSAKATASPLLSIRQKTAVSTDLVRPVPSPNGSGFESEDVQSIPWFPYGGEPTPALRTWIPYWRFEGNSGITQRHRGHGHLTQDANHNNNAPNRAAYIRSNGWIRSANMNNIPAGMWRVRFEATQRIYDGGNPNGSDPVSTQRLLVQINGQPVGEFQPANGRDAAVYWEYASRPIRLANPGTVQIRIDGLVPYETALIDNIRLEPLSDWNVASTWAPSGVPVATDTVLIPDGVLVGLQEDVASAGPVTVNGELVVLDTETGGPATLTADSVHVIRDTQTDSTEPGRILAGRMEVGIPSHPLVGSFTLTLKGVDDGTDGTMGPGSRFLAATKGGQLILHGEERSTWTRLTGVFNIGNEQRPRQISVVERSVDWEVGDWIVIAGSHIQDARGGTQPNCVPPAEDESEKCKIVAIDWSDHDNPLYELEFALANDHTTADPQSYNNDPSATPMHPVTTDHVNTSWVLDQRAEVGLLTRNILIQGHDDGIPTGFGGHLMVSQAWDYDAEPSVLNASSVEFRKMGQKDTRGQRGRLGRYPIHWHVMLDLAAGQFVSNCSIYDCFNRAVTIHGTDSILIEDNVIVDSVGHAVFLEDGSEQDNTFIRNLVINTKRPPEGEELLPSDNGLCKVQDRCPASFWITNPTNNFIDNVAAGTPGTGFWYIFPQTGVLGLSQGTSANIPDKANVAIYEWSHGRQPRTQPPGTFSGNSAHSCGSGFDVNDVIIPGTNEILSNYFWMLPPSSADHITGFTAFGCFDGIYTSSGTLASPIRFTDCILADNIENLRIGAGTEIRKTVIISDTGNVQDPGEQQYRSGFVYYDGFGLLETCHFVGFGQNEPLGNYTDCAAVDFKGGAAIYAANSFEDITFPGVTDNDQVFIKFRNMPFVSGGIPPTDDYPICADGTTNDPNFVRRWGPTLRLRDETLWRDDTLLGSVAQQDVNWTITGSHPLVVTTRTSTVHPNLPTLTSIVPASPMTHWNGLSGARISSDRFGLVRFQTTGSLPEVEVTREAYSFGGRSEDAVGPYCLKFSTSLTSSRMIPAIINRGFEYRFGLLNPNDAWPDIVNLRVSDLDQDHSANGDLVILRFEGIFSADPANPTQVKYPGDGPLLPQLSGVPTPGMTLTEPKYYGDPITGDLWIAFVGPGESVKNDINVWIENP